MSYRLPPCPRPAMPIVHSSTQSDVIVDNGTIAHLVIPFFRKNCKMITRRDIMQQDHIGWPDPGHRDRSWQPWMSFNSSPIDLKEEGYDSIEIAFSPEVSGLTAVGDIQDHFVRIDIESMCPDAEDEDLFVQFSAYLVGETLRDIASKGTIHIVAGPINEGE